MVTKSGADETEACPFIVLFTQLSLPLFLQKPIGLQIWSSPISKDCPTWRSQATFISYNLRKDEMVSRQSLKAVDTRKRISRSSNRKLRTRNDGGGGEYFAQT